MESWQSLSIISADDYVARRKLHGLTSAFHLKMKMFTQSPGTSSKHQKQIQMHRQKEKNVKQTKIKVRV